MRGCSEKQETVICIVGGQFLARAVDLSKLEKENLKVGSLG